MANSTASHKHLGKQCPVTGSHNWCPPQEGDSRSPCPALNSMANHGYIARDGKKIGIFDLFHGLRACYGLTRTLTFVLVVGSFFILRRITPLSLEEIGKHDAIEHNASLVHVDCPDDKEYAPIAVVPELVDALMKEGDSDEKSDGSELTIKNLADFRVRRERECRPVDSVHDVIARGEMAIAFGMWAKDRAGIPKEWLRDWLENGRLPKAWRPTHSQGLLDTMRRSDSIKKWMKSGKLPSGSDNSLSTQL
ncbi:hypothetical protein APHAL10511_001484 [Amanita phalloides]|nr:hypothetical protein APHAL10511_001484 [Amanita phalloides]